MGKYAYFLFTAFFCFFGCETNTAEILEYGQHNFFEYAKEFVMQAGGTAISSDGKVRVDFENILEDSRCPSDVECVWAGQVKVQIGFLTDDKDSMKQEIIMEGTSLAQAWLPNGYNIKLLSVNPYPVSTKQIRLEDYKITLIVTKS